MNKFLIKQMSKAFPKNWGFYLCTKCAEQKLENKDIHNAIEEAKKKGVLEPCEGQDCVYCKGKADYKLILNKASKVL